MDRYRAYVKSFTDTRRAYNNVNGAKYLLGEEDLTQGRPVGTMFLIKRC